MSELSRHDVLTGGGAAALGLAALLGAPGGASAQGTSKAAPAGVSGLAGVIPGAVDENGAYVLPPLPYEYSAVSEFCDEQTMRLHHDKHHAGYVRGLIGAEAKMAEARESGDFTNIDYWERKAAFHGAGHFLHCVFWSSMSPDGGGDATGNLAGQIKKDFGSTKQLVAHFSAASKSVEGSGWGILGWSIGGQKLVVLQAMNHQLLTQWAVVPLICLDVWEHAYYLKYQNNRGAYVENFPKVIDWKHVGERFEMLMG